MGRFDCIDIFIGNLDIFSFAPSDSVSINVILNIIGQCKVKSITKMYVVTNNNKEHQF